MDVSFIKLGLDNLNFAGKVWSTLEVEQSYPIRLRPRANAIKRFYCNLLMGEISKRLGRLQPRAMFTIKTEAWPSGTFRGKARGQRYKFFLQT